MGDSWKGKAGCSECSRSPVQPAKAPVGSVKLAAMLTLALEWLLGRERLAEAMAINPQPARATSDLAKGDWWLTHDAPLVAASQTSWRL
jgi:hypothetical protein